MSKILVVGYGNPLRADDGLGCHVARQIGHHLRGDERVEVVPCHQLAPEIAEQIAKAEFVIFVDASTQGEPGTITQSTVPADKEFAGKLADPTTPGMLLAAAQTMHGACPSAVMFAMTGWCFEFGEQMSSIVSERFAALVQMIEKTIAENEAAMVS
ncbi:Peptidase M52, hydrogen uptake protein [Candidatus Koribacter versatilis Ellin345]|uniref:Peptidase M52, hydrogen uptake protein n=1 Tax=Koribacter versatilis (strain Ellin345) TaxID=204669 RepID=Q1IRE3_KORVE|nr:hydrogenase maturation protease [Candidatus Koribacter versatilis]ABF40557.1 Peptidase M52, hydrogen uptake protein [Candidatus Koribacter versatilis Ellin345]